MTRLVSPSGVPASRLCFGTMQFGVADEAASRAMYDAARAAGITFFDTAHSYTGGESERMLGRFAARERDAVIVATKVAFEPGGGRRARVLADFDESRRRLGLDVVDVLYLHRLDPLTPLDDTFEALAELHGRGLIWHVGISNFPAWQTVKADAIAQMFGLTVDVLQPMYSLVKRQAEVEILPMAAAEGMAVAPYSPLGGGLLTGKYARGEAGRLTSDPRYRDRYAPTWMHETAARLAAVAAEAGAHPATLAVAWAMEHPAVTAPIVSARSAEQLAPSLAAMDFRMNPCLRARLSALSPAPPPATDRLEEAG